MADDDLFELESTLRRIAKKLPHEWKKHSSTGLSRTEAVVLYTLHTEGQQRASQLAASLSITSGGITGVTDKLVGEGYIHRKRDHNDRRVVYLTISEKGKEALESMYVSRANFLQALFSGIPTEEIDQLALVTNKILANLEREKEQGSER